MWQDAMSRMTITGTLSCRLLCCWTGGSHTGNRSEVRASHPLLPACLGHTLSYRVEQQRDRYINPISADQPQRQAPARARELAGQGRAGQGRAGQGRAGRNFDGRAGLHDSRPAEAALGGLTEVSSSTTTTSPAAPVPPPAHPIMV